MTTVLSPAGRRVRWLVAGALCATLAFPNASSAQSRISFGAGVGLAGSTDASLSNGHAGVLLMGQFTHGMLPFVGLGVELNHWTRSSTDATFATGIVQVHVPLTGLLLKAGAGYGGGDPDGLGRINGVAGQVGLAYDMTLPGAPIALTWFGSALLAHASSRSLQLVGAGVALTFR